MSPISPNKPRSNAATVSFISSFTPKLVVNPVTHCSISFICNPAARLGEKTLGIDYGTRRIGVATSIGISPTPLPSLSHSNTPKEAALLISKLAKSHICEQVLVGLPLETSGKEGSQVVATKRFVQHLIHFAPWAKIVAIDERYTSREARDILWEKGVRGAELKELEHSYSAVVILNRFFADTEEVIQVLHRPPPGASVENVVEQLPIDRMSYREWKKAAMERAKEQALKDS